MEYENDQQQYDDGDRNYDRDRSRSPRPDHRDQSDGPAQDGTNGRDRPPVAPPEEDEEAARNTGTNLFVTGIHPRLSEEGVARLFEKYGQVEKCNIMRDPHTRESRGFGFVNMVSSDQADAAREGLQGEVIEGRTLSIEKARRNRPRTPTPGKYFGPPKRDDFRGPPRRGGRGGFDDRARYDDRRRYDDRGYDRRDEPYHRSRDRYDDRKDYRRDRYYDERPPRREDRHGRDGERGGGRGGRDYYDKSSGRGAESGYGQEPLGATDSYGSRGGPPAGGAGSGGNYEDRGGEDRYRR